jgi:hypothetical protein
MWDLTVADLHDFAVGAGQYVVHNCNYNRDEFGKTPSAKAKRIVRQREPICRWCGGATETGDHEPSLVRRWHTGEFDGMTSDDMKSAANDPNQMVGSCNSCNFSKGGREVGTGPGQWDPRTSPRNMERGGPGELPWNPLWDS